MPSDDEILVDDSDLFESFRQQRMFELRSQIHSRSLDDQVFGLLSEIGHEKELLSLTTSLPRLLIHFHNPAFKSCRILNDHLSKLAKKYPRTRIVYIDAAKAPFMIVKMQIQMLPCVVAVVDTMAVDRIVGFDDLGGTDSFNTQQLEDRLNSGSSIFKIPNFKLTSSKGIMDTYHSEDDSD